jgi:4a-hydroxytetrahydrobiopterin dehydratase
MTCSAETPLLIDDEISRRLRVLDGWTRGESWIEKTYRFKNFVRAISFVNAVAFVAEQSNHHPDIAIHYSEVRLRNWTHAAGGLTSYDFELAEKIDSLVESKSRQAAS